ncbi:DUF2795 domain-containing protein [Saccharopolyspora sp. HNM0983]|uniref:DUF2795 domain-containing protein n=1 Tax=Saccharopolyspora montiporae TaxID=2781240 RepID=A0A929BEK0_9PSEU|nr:DUF2795 domain-containing protein [Saccharopolyspora sp. HNM0983]MBE9376047.1 DUF2795 domain-containing protein [Saccharopolyspora sp. HNM0983]
MTKRDELRVLKALQGLEYPATAERILDYAQTRDVDAQTLRALSALPEGEYGSAAEVEQAVPQRPEQAG